MAIEHNDIPPDGRHAPHSWSVATAAALANLTVSTNDIGKIALQLDQDILMRLSSVTLGVGTWKEIGPAATVTSVAGKLGVVVLESTDLTDSTTTGRSVLTAADPAAARTALGAGTSSFDGAYASLTGKPTLGTSADKNVGTGAGTVTAGDDPRLSDSRPPTVHSHPATEINDSTAVGRSVLTAADAAAARAAIGAGSSSFDGTYASLTGKPTLGDAAAKNTGTTAGTVAAGDDSRLSDSRTPTAHTHIATEISDSTAVGRSVLTATEAAAARAAISAETSGSVTAHAGEADPHPGYVLESTVGQANGIAPLDGTGKVASSFLPSYVDDVIEAADFASLPGTGEAGKIYVTLDNGKTWRWSGSAYAEISASPGSTDAVSEGSTNLYHTAARVRDTILTGLSVAAGTMVTAAHTVLEAIGFLQKQVSDNLSTLTAHTGNTSNPHSTTAAQVGAAASGDITASGLTQSTDRLLGRYSASTGAVQEITVSTGLDLDGAGLLTAVGTPPTGGSTGQVLSKNSNTDYDYVWSTPSSTQGRHSIYVPATEIRPSVSAGCALLAFVAGASDQPDLATLDFDPASQEYAQFSIVLPKKWNEGTITFRAHWSHPSTTTDFGVAFDLQAVAVSDADPIGSTFGSSQVVVDTGGTADSLYSSPESSAITVGGTPAAEDMVFFRVSRPVANGGDTMAVDARLHGITVYLTTNADTDA
jgi:hypothetical protein